MLVPNTFAQLAELTYELNIRDTEIKRADNIYESITKNILGSIIIVFDADLNIFLVDGSSNNTINKISHIHSITKLDARIVTTGEKSFATICQDALNGTSYSGEATFGSHRKFLQVTAMYDGDGSRSKFGGMAAFIDM